MRYFKIVFCISLLFIMNSEYANSQDFRQNPDSLDLNETPVYADVLKSAYSFLFFSPMQDRFSSPALLMNTDWEYNGTQNFQKLTIFADDYMTNHYGKFVFEIKETNRKCAYFVNFFKGIVKQIPLQPNGYGPQDEDDLVWNKTGVIHYHHDNNKIVPFAHYGTSQMCYISLQDQMGDWHFIFLHTGILCFQ